MVTCPRCGLSPDRTLRCDCGFDLTSNRDAIRFERLRQWWAWTVDRMTSSTRQSRVDRILRDGDTIRMADVLLTARHTPGHTRGATTWIANMAVDGRSYVVDFPDGAGINPGYRLVTQPSYPGIADDYRRTHHVLEMLKPDIWLAQHNEYYDLQGKRQRAETIGVQAWVDPEGYRRFVAGKKRAFEHEVDEEMEAPNVKK